MERAMKKNAAYSIKLCDDGVMAQANLIQFSI